MAAPPGGASESGDSCKFLPLVIHEADVGLIDQRACLKVVVRALASHVPVRQPAELRIDDRRQLVEGELVSAAPGAEQLADVVRTILQVRCSHHRCQIVLPAAHSPPFRPYNPHELALTPVLASVRMKRRPDRRGWHGRGVHSHRHNKF